MARAASATKPDFRQSLLDTYAVNDYMNRLVLERLDPRAWRAKPTGRNVRTIAAIFAHMHNARRKWLRLSAMHLALPAELDRLRCSQQQVRVALAKSARLCSKMLEEAFDPEGRVKYFHRDGWARRWPTGVTMFAYMIMHDVHHRGQICMLAHQLGYPIKNGHEIWMWERLWKQCGFAL
jgi:uncharacterized damage-inducible protein DinB